MKLDTILPFLLAHKWLALAVVVVGAIVRLSKSDAKFPLDVPAKWRPLLSVALGLGLGVLERRAAGKTWFEAINSGLLVGSIPILAHGLGIEWLRKGKEFSLPDFLTRTLAEASKAQTKNDNDDEPPTTGLALRVNDPVEAAPPSDRETPVEPPPNAARSSFRLSLVPAFVLSFLVPTVITSCMFPFEEARIVSLGPPSASGSASSPAKRDPSECETLDKQKTYWGAAAKGLGLAGGAGGLTALKLSDDKLRDGIAIGSGVAAALGVFSLAMGEWYSAQWVKKGCAGS